MTQYWDLENGTLKVWTHDQDPSTDDPAQTMTKESWTWGNRPDEVEDLLEAEWEKGVPSQASGLTARAAAIQMDLIRGRIERRA